MPTSKAITASKLFGKDRYESYLNELLTENTVGGQKLSKTQLREGFSKRKNKISFEKFVDKIIATKTAKSATVSSGRKSSQLFAGKSIGASGALVKSPVGTLQKYVEDISKSKSSGGVDNNIASTANSMSSIVKTLEQQNKLTKENSAYDKRKKEKDKRELAESKLEKRFEGLKKAAEKILAPVKNILDKIINFLVTVFLGRVVYKLVEWIGNPENANKVKTVIRFLGDQWPKLLALYLTFGTSLGRFALGLTRAVARGAVKLLAKIAMLAAAKKVRNARSAARFLSRGPGKLAANIIGTGAALGGAYALTQGFKGTEEQKTQNYSGGGYVTPRFPAFSGGGFNFGNKSLSDMFGSLGMTNEKDQNSQRSGFVSGEKGVDKVPAMLSDGEFVMSTGAVQKYGVDTLEAMNAAGGGTNKPKIISGTTYAAGGGLIPGADKPTDASAMQNRRKLEKQKASESGGILGALGKFLPGTGRVMAPKSGGQRDIQGIQQTMAGYQNKLLGINLGGVNFPRGKRGEYSEQENRRYYERTGKYFIPTQYPGGAGIHGLYTPSRQQKSSATSKTNQRLNIAIQNARDIANIPGVGAYKPLIESTASTALKMQQRSDMLRNAMRQAGMRGAEENMNIYGKPITEKYAKGGYAPRDSQPVSINANINSITPLKVNQFKSARPKIGNNITPPPRRTSSTRNINTGMKSGNYNMTGGKATAGTQIPSFSAINPVSGNTKQKTLGIVR